MGTNDQPWILTQESIDRAIRNITWTDKTLFFPSGLYYSEKPLVIDFAVRCENDTDARNVLREGVAIVGDLRSSIIQFPRLHINNGYTASTEAKGLIVFRALRSDFFLDVTCGRGVALWLENNEFSTYRGSFSNAEDTSTNPVSIFTDSYGLLLNNAVNLHFQSMNLEVVYNGIKLLHSSQGNLFSSVIANNQDERGVVVSYEDLYSGSRNYFFMMTRRTTRQNKTAYPKLIGNPTEQIIFQYDLLS